MHTPGGSVWILASVAAPALETTAIQPAAQQVCCESKPNWVRSLLYILAIRTQQRSFASMFAQNLLLLPKALVEARRRAGLLQKSAAVAGGVGQTVLCAIEKGRRTPEDFGLLEQLARAYDLAEMEREELFFAAAHDRQLQAIRDTRLEGAAELLSEALKTYRALSAPEIAGLVLELREISQGKRRVNALARRARAGQPKEEAPM